MTKSELRKIYLAKQKSISSAERVKLSRQICENLFKHFSLENINIVHVFLPIERTNEIETSFIIKQLWRQSKKTVIPHVNFELNGMESVVFDTESRISLNKWQIPERNEMEIFEPQLIDLIIVPLLCFDEKGFRVGYGKGFYDRFLVTCRSDCLKVGLSYFPAVAEISDAESFDVKLDFCITPKKIFDVNLSEL